MNAATPDLVPFQDLPLQVRLLRNQIDPALDRVLKHGQFILGEEVTEFEQAWAKFCRVSHAIGVGSGTDALQLILRALKIGPADEVITVANTFIATAEAISYTGARPVLVDCDSTYHLVDVEAVAAAITPRTRAIIPVHLYGQPANMEALETLAARHGVPLIEDAAQAHGAALRDGRPCGSIGLASGFSFYPGKNLGAFGDGGAVTTSDDELSRQIRLLRNWGSVVKYHHEVQGYNSRLDAIQAAILTVKLGYLSRWNEQRRTIAGWYRERLSGVTQIILPSEAPWTSRHVYHLFVVQIDAFDRDRLAEALRRDGIQTVVHYPVPIHLQRAYTELGYTRGAFPTAEAAAQRILSLPMFPEMTVEQCDRVCDSIRRALVSG